MSPTASIAVFVTSQNTGNGALTTPDTSSARPDSLLEEAGRHVDHVVHRGLVESPITAFSAARSGAAIPVGDLPLHRVRFRPAEPGGVAAGIERDIRRRIHAVRAGMPGVEDVPAALVRRLLAGAALADGAPVQRLILHVHADPLQQIGRHVALRLGDRRRRCATSRTIGSFL